MNNMNKINTKIIADSIGLNGHRVTTMLLTYPRMIHSEIMTHRLFSRNAASSRAIPFKKMVEMVESDPFIPIAWQKTHSGMQGSEYETDPKQIEENRKNWVESSRLVIEKAKTLNDDDVTKQLTNRLLEPYLWYTVLVTATEWDNFFDLRCPEYVNPDSQLHYKSKKDFLKKESLDFSPYNQFGWYGINKSQAEIHIQELAETMWDALNESTPQVLKPGEWHIPFGDKMDNTELEKLVKSQTFFDDSPEFYTLLPSKVNKLKLKIGTARCARLSYMTFDNNIDYQKDIVLHGQLYQSKHFSPFEHCCRAMTEEEISKFGKTKSIDGDIEHGWCNNFKGFIQYRFFIE